MIDCLRHYALVTHDVPAERVRPHLPRLPGLELETLGERALVSVACFRNEHLRWDLLRGVRGVGLSFEQCVYRTYVRYRGRSAVFVFESFLSSTASYLLERSILRNSHPGKFLFRAEEKPEGYPHLSCDIRADEGNTYLRLHALECPKPKQPFDGVASLLRFLANRPTALFLGPTGMIMSQAVSHAELRPWAGRLEEGEFGPWARYGILKPGENSRAFSVLVEPAVTFNLATPLPARLLARGTSVAASLLQ